jgi:hypothetical protein
MPEGYTNAQTMDASQSCREKKEKYGTRSSRPRGMESARKDKQIVQAVR